MRHSIRKKINKRFPNTFSSQLPFVPRQSINPKPKKIQRVHKKRKRLILKKQKLSRCNTCNKTFRNVGLLRIHQKKSCGTVTKRFKCRRCYRIFQTEVRLQEHTLSNCDTLKIFGCDVCGKRYIFKRLLIDHITPVCKTLRRPKCSECQRTFSSPHALKRHKVVDHGQGVSVRKHLCHICGKEVKHLTHHLETHSEENFDCVQCGKQFKTRPYLRDHMQMHNAIPRVSCAECGKSFPRMRNLRLHMSVHGMVTSMCKICGKGLKNKDQLRTHYRTHELPYECRLCGKRFVSSKSLNFHLDFCLLKTNPKEEKPFMCSICGKAFRKKPALRSHSFVHTEERPFSCEKCGKCFKTRRCLRGHLATHRKSCSDEKVQMKLNQNFSSDCQSSVKTEFETSGYQEIELLAGIKVEESVKTELGSLIKIETEIESLVKTEVERVVIHELVSSVKPEVENKLKNVWIPSESIKNDIKPSICSDCGKAFISRSHLSAHRRTVHSGKSFNCKDCGNSYKSRQSLRRHTVVKHSGKIISFPCESCEKSYSSKSDLKRHILSHALVQTVLGNVNVKETEESSVLSNVNVQKTEESSVLSNVNVQKTEGSSVLSIVNVQKTEGSSVLNIVNGQKTDGSYLCKVCGKSFSTMHRLQVHFTIHNGEKPFSCTICKRPFRLRRYLNLHMAQHGIATGMTQHICSTCGKMFSTKLLLDSHLRIHTGEKPYGCIQCGHRCRTMRALKRHLLVHSNVRPYPCKMCEKSFMRMETLKQHVCYGRETLQSENSLLNFNIKSEQPSSVEPITLLQPVTLLKPESVNVSESESIVFEKPNAIIEASSTPEEVINFIPENNFDKELFLKEFYMAFIPNLYLEDGKTSALNDSDILIPLDMGTESPSATIETTLKMDQW